MSETTGHNSKPENQRTKSTLFNHLSQLRKWQEEQILQLRDKQQTQWMQLQEEQMRIGKLMEQHQGIEIAETDQNSSEDQLRTTIPNNPEQDMLPNRQHFSEKMKLPEDNVPYRNPNSEEDNCREFLQEKSFPQCESLESKEDDCKMIPQEKKEDDTNMESVIRENANSFDELIEQQMLKRQRNDTETIPETTINKSIPKRPFLKKKSGLSRFQPKSISHPKNKIPERNIEAEPICRKNSPGYLQKTLKLKPALRKNDVQPKCVKHIRFEVPSAEVVVNEESTPAENWHEAPLTRGPSNNSYNTNEEKRHNLEAIKLKESEELAEFEILENIAQNSSFSSDSSVVQKLLHGEPLQKTGSKNMCTGTKPQSVQVSNEEEQNIRMDGQFAERLSQYTDLQDLFSIAQTRKQVLEQKILDMQPRTISLTSETQSVSSESATGNPVSTVTLSSSDENDAFTSEIIARDQRPSLEFTTNSENCASPNESSVYDSDLDVSVVAMCGPDPHLLLPEETPNSLKTDDNEESNISRQQVSSKVINPENISKSDCTNSGQSMIKQKLIELEAEIKTFTAQNSQLKLLTKEKEEMVKRLKKEHEEFEKFQEIEKKRFEKEIGEQKMQLRREKQTFERYHRLRKELPGQKEREEFTVLKQQVEKLQEELKKQSVKWSSENQRLRILLATAEKERETLRKENQTLEESRLDLLSALKVKKKKEAIETSSKLSNADNTKILPVQLMTHDKAKEDIRVKKICDFITKESSISESSLEQDSTRLEYLSEINSEDILDSKHHVHFNLEHKDSSSSINSDNLDFRQVQHGDKLEKIFRNGEKEVIFPSGTRKYISADGLNIKFHFYNGDTKEIFPDQRIVYIYTDGTVEAHYPDGLDVFEFSNGQVEKHYPDGMKNVTFVDGTQHILHSDGSEEMRIPDGTVLKIGADGNETVEFPSGEREIRTADYQSREYKNGTVKTVYESGRQETRYASGRVRVKDKDGNVLVDTKHLKSNKASKWIRVS